MSAMDTIGLNWRPGIAMLTISVLWWGYRWWQRRRAA